MSDENKKIFIPAPLYKRLKKRVTDTEFETVSKYVTYILEEVLSSLEEDEQEEEVSTEDEEKVKERLRALGYLD